MCCGPIREAVRAATHYYTRAWQHVNTRKRMLYRHCYIPSFPAQVFTIHRTMFRNLRLRACRAIIPLQPGNDVIAGLKWYCSPASPNRNNHRTMFLNLWPRACRAVIPFQTGNDVIAGLKWYCSPASPNRNNHRTMFLNLWPRACRAVIPFQTGNDVIARLK